MAPRHPPDRPNELRPSARKAAKDITPANDRPAPESDRNAPRLVKPEDVELDRIEAYLRGPTAFTA